MPHFRAPRDVAQCRGSGWMPTPRYRLHGDGISEWPVTDTRHSSRFVPVHEIPFPTWLRRAPGSGRVPKNTPVLECGTGVRRHPHNVPFRSIVRRSPNRARRSSEHRRRDRARHSMKIRAHRGVRRTLRMRCPTGDATSGLTCARRAHFPHRVDPV